MKTLNTLRFCPITTNKFIERGRHDVLVLGNQTQLVSKLARKPRGPLKAPMMYDVLHYDLLSSNNGDNDSKGDLSSGAPNCPDRRYTCWFQPQIWLKIEAELLQALHHYQVSKAKEPDTKHSNNVYISQWEYSMRMVWGQSMARHWGHALRQPSQHSRITTRLQTSCMRPGVQSIWKGHRDVDTKFIDWMLQLHDTNVGLNSLLIAFQMKVFCCLIFLRFVQSVVNSLKSLKALFGCGWRKGLDGAFENQQATQANSSRTGSLKGSSSCFKLHALSLVLAFCRV